MLSQVTNRHFEARLRDNTAQRPDYVVTLKKDTLLKFFGVLKQPGFALLRIDHNAKMEMNFTCERCPNISVVQEVASRQI